MDWLYLLVPLAALYWLLKPFFSLFSCVCSLCESDDITADASDWRERERQLEQESSANDRDQY